MSGSGSGKLSHTQSVVFDAEPLMTWIEGSTGAQTVEGYLTDTYHGYIETYISRVNLTEVCYNSADYQTLQYGKRQAQTLQNMGVVPVDTDSTWERAAEYKHEYTPSFPLGDAYALATAAEKGLPLLVGQDQHWDDPEDDGHDIVRVP
jgi:PIN domain nuclease of toxin-antitoxin system